MKTQHAEAPWPRFYELEQFRQSVNRKLWFGMGILALVSMGCLAYGILVAIKPTPVIAFDSEGRPLVFTDTVTPRQQLDKIRVEYFARTFLEHYVGIDSAALDRDLKEALNMMSARLREVSMADATEFERRAKFQGANVRSRFDDLQLKIAPYDPESSPQVHLIAWGQMTFEPRVGVVEDKERVSQWMFSQMVLKRAPIDVLSIHGLQVDYIHTQFFDSEEAMRIERLKRKP